MRRMMLGMSQEKLGEAFGLTFQQIQKYEKGMNRMGSSRLQQAADILGVAVPFFFEGGPGGSRKMHGNAPSPSYVNEFVSSSDGLRLAKAFNADRECRDATPDRYTGARGRWRWRVEAAGLREKARQSVPTKRSRR